MKYIEVKQLYKETIKDIRSNEDNWLQFLKSASWNFKYNFDDQILIYAQKPNATACAEMKEWNEKVTPKRWVNKDTKGIAIYAKEGSTLPLRFVFDISDTHNYRNTEYKLWSAEEQYQNEIIEALEDKFGTINNKENLGQALIEISYNMATDNIQDYLVTIEKYKKNTPLKNMETEEIKSLFLLNVWASVTYMMMTRCGIEPEQYISKQEFSNMKYFNNSNLITILGTATSEIAETGLREIAKTIRNLRIEEKNQNRTFAEKENQEYSNNKEIEKGGKGYDENRLHDTGRLSNTKYNSERREDSKWKIRKNEVEFPKNTQESRVHNIENGQQIDTTFKTSTRTSNEYDTRNDRENAESRGDNRNIEDDRPYEMDRLNEQLQDDGRTTSSERDNLQLDLPTEQEQKQKIAEVENTSVLSFTQEMIDDELQIGSHTVDGKFRIFEYLSQNHSSKENADFLKKEYGEGGWSPNHFDLSEWHNAKGILLTKGHEDNAPSLLLSWYDVEKRIRQLISDDRYLNDKEKEEYLKWQEDKQIDKKDTSVEKTEKIDNSNEEFAYRLQDRVFIGANEYEIININDKKVTIADIKFPIFMQEFDFDVFDKRVRETPYNDHLKKSNRNDLKEQQEDLQDFLNNIIALGKIDGIEIVVDDNNDIQKIKMKDSELSLQQFYSYLIEFFDENSQLISNVELDRLNKELEQIRKDNKTKYIGKNIIYKDEQYTIIGIDEGNDYAIGDLAVLQSQDSPEKRTIEPLDYIDWLIEKDIENVQKKSKVYAPKRKSDFENWLDTFIEEKGIDLNQIIEIKTDNNTHFFEIGNIVDNIKVTTKEEQAKIKDMIVKIDFNNGNVVDYFEHLAKGFAQNYEKQEEKIIPQIKRKRKNKIEYFDLHPEIPLEQRNNYRITDNQLGEGTLKEKYSRNIEAIKTLKKCENENRYATIDEQEIMSKYVGWGGLPEAFDKNNSSWTKEYEELKSLLTEKEYEEARKTTLTAFYTPPIVIKAMYKALENMGLEKGNILEPSCRSW